ncbi:cyclic peptide export ABC transporter [Chitinophaga sp. 30R24]|uniref:cyclic peptide export ABC transporter n=1 Tax=Chitinophaga sp. 30R24 TaxID=3248838 RepID=UPI003B91CF6C
MDIFKLFQKRSKLFYLSLLFLGLINAVWSSVLLLFINGKIAGEQTPFMNNYDWRIYVALIVSSFITSRFFQVYMIRLTYDLGNDLALSIFQKLRFSNYEEYTELGEDKVRTAMADVVVLQRFPQAFIETFNAAVMVLIGLGYLFWVNTISALVVFAVLIILGTLYYLRNMVIQRDLNKARDLANVYQQNVNDFLRGFREVKMSTKRSDNIYHDFLVTNRNKVKELTVKSILKLMGNELIGNYSWYMMLGMVLFAIPVLLHTSIHDSSSFVITLLFLMGPVSIVITEIKEFTMMQIAIARINQFNELLKAAELIEMGHGDMTPINTTFESIRFEDVVYEYFDEKKKETFRLQPLNIDIRKGDCIFVTGGNGSGKSTFIHLLTGLYVPCSGRIYLNDVLIDQSNYPYYRNQLSAIFTDCHLFSENYDRFALQDNEQLKFLINEMQLKDVIKIDEEKNRISTNLSKGQQKRLALICLLLEDKDVIVLDEWAAEQDPSFRAIFYKEIIPELKRKGKTVIAVTHDDQYFHCAEKVVKFDYGTIVDININQPLLEVQM